MSAGKVIIAKTQNSDLMCCFILRSEVDQGSKHLKLAAFTNNEGYEVGEKVIYGYMYVRYLQVSPHHKAKIPFIDEVQRP